MTLPAPPAKRLPTRIFKSGNSLSVRIPASMVPHQVPSDAEIEYVGGVWTIRPIARRKLDGLAAKLRAFSPGFMADGRLAQGQRERDWGGPVLSPPPKSRSRAGKA